MSDPVRVRFAPSPTGALHVGGVRTALFNWLFARKHEGVFVLRIEDTDEARSTEESRRSILEGFRWVGLEWDEGPDVGGPYGPYVQSERRPIYDRYAQRLLDADLAYPCYCTPDELQARREQMERRGIAPRYDGRCRSLTPEQRAALEAEGRPSCLRFRMPTTGAVQFEDLVHGPKQFDNRLLEDFIVRKSSGFPTYNFACVVDDHEMRISHVIRAEQHLSNTPRQIHLYDALGLPRPLYAHVSHVLAPDRSKLSKRHGATDLGEFRDLGYLPEAMLNYLALLGWSTGDETEIMSADELVRRFDLDRVGKSGAIFDRPKLDYVNSEYIKAMPAPELAKRAIPVLQRAGLLPEHVSPEQHSYVERVVDLMRERLKTLRDLVDLGAYFFADVVHPDEKARRQWLDQDWVPGVLGQLAARLADVEPWRLEAIEQAVRAVAEEQGLSGGQVIHPTRAAVTGMTFGPGLFELLAVLGRDRVLARLRAAAGA
jgi:glutamyl-tRNA synthetase